MALSDAIQQITDAAVRANTLIAQLQAAGLPGETVRLIRDLENEVATVGLAVQRMSDAAADAHEFIEAAKGLPGLAEKFLADYRRGVAIRPGPDGWTVRPLEADKPGG